MGVGSESPPSWAKYFLDKTVLPCIVTDQVLNYGKKNSYSLIDWPKEIVEVLTNHGIIVAVVIGPKYWHRSVCDAAPPFIELIKPIFVG